MDEICEGGVWDILLSQEQANQIVDKEVEVAVNTLQEKVNVSVKSLAGKVADLQTKVNDLKAQIEQMQ